jgi:hypothetical protein
MSTKMERLPLLLFLLLPSLSFAQLSATAVQTAKGNTGSAVASSFTITLGSTPTDGNYLVLTVVTNATPVLNISMTNVEWREANGASAYDITGV